LTNNNRRFIITDQSNFTRGFYRNKATVKRNIPGKFLAPKTRPKDSSWWPGETDSTLGQLVSVSLHTYPVLFTWPSRNSSQGNELKSF